MPYGICEHERVKVVLKKSIDQHRIFFRFIYDTYPFGKINLLTVLPTSTK